MKLFDIRTDASHAGAIASINRGMESVPGNPYTARFGPIGTEPWWTAYDRGELPVEILCGTMSRVGARSKPQSDEPEDIVEFVVGGLAIAYDRVDHWSAVPICVGDRIAVTRTVVELVARTGPVSYHIDLCAEWFAAERSVSNSKDS